MRPLRRALLPALVSALMICCPGSTAAQNGFLGSVDERTYGETTLEEIEDVDLRTFSARLTHPYEVRLQGTAPQRMVLCQLFDAQGTVVAGELENTNTGETRIFFTEKTPDLTARCFYADVERSVRP